MTKLYLSFFLLLTMFAGCGGGDSGNSEEFKRQEEQDPEPDTLQRIYRTDLRAVNPTVVKRVEGQVIIRLVGDDFQVNLAVQNVPSSVHRQHIRTGSNCPTIEADTNQDGLIGLAEAEVVSGSVFIPLDSDLDNQSEDRYPTGGFLKAFVYKEKTSRSRLQSDLGRGNKFDLGNRVIMVLGTDEDPTLPIACGELTKVIGQP